MYCGTGKGSRYTNCTGGCGNTNRFDHIATRVATEEQEAEIRYLIDDMAEAGFEDLWKCLHECPNTYTRLLSYNDFTLRYVLKCFIAGGQTGLRGDILAQLLCDLAPEVGVDSYGGSNVNAQAFFAQWEDAAKRFSAKHGEEWMEEHQPAMALLLRMLNMR